MSNELSKRLGLSDSLIESVKKVLGEELYFIPEDIPVKERTAFHGAAAAAHKSGKKKFDFQGKSYPVTMKKDVANKIASEDIERTADVKMVKVKQPDGRVTMKRQRKEVKIGEETVLEDFVNEDMKTIGPGVKMMKPVKGTAGKTQKVGGKLSHPPRKPNRLKPDPMMTKSEEDVDEASAADVLKKRYASNRPEDNPQATKIVKDAIPGVKTNKLHPHAGLTNRGYSKKGKMAALKKQHARRPAQYGITREEETIDEDPFKGQPTGVSVTMKHKTTGQKQKASFPGTHSAVAGAKAHIAKMQKRGYEVHSKNLMYGKNEQAVTEAKSSMYKSPAHARLQKHMNKIRKTSSYQSQVKAMGGEPKKPNEEVSEARRGRPPKVAPKTPGDTEARQNIVHQLRKSVSLRGQHPVEFKDGKTHKVKAQHAMKALTVYGNLRTTGEKKAYQDKLHHSHDSFQKALSDKNPGKPVRAGGISLPGSSKIGGTQR